MSSAARPSRLDPDIAQRLKRDAAGLFVAVAQQHDTGEVLMVGWMDDEALHRTLTTGRCTYWSRSRQEYWVKGDTSGHQQWVKSVALDCDGDTVLVTVDQVGAACHTGERTCFDRRAAGRGRGGTPRAGRRGAPRGGLTAVPAPTGATPESAVPSGPARPPIPRAPPFPPALPVPLAPLAPPFPPVPRTRRCAGSSC